MREGGFFSRRLKNRTTQPPSSHEPATTEPEPFPAASVAATSVAPEPATADATTGSATNPEAELDAETVWSTGTDVAGIYRIGEELGAGGMGVVHKVRHLGWGQDLAVKSPRPSLWAAGIPAFVEEATVWVDLPPHPHLCTCYYVRVIGGVPRIFAELVEGGSVAEALREGRLGDLAEILDVAIQMAWGLRAAHEAGVVHQDVKPANALISADGTVKITDFGLARAQARASAGTTAPAGNAHAAAVPPHDQAGATTETGTTPAGSTGAGTPRAAATSAAATEAGTAAQAGAIDASALVTHRGMTPAYASPEQASGRASGRRSDVWSWAVSVLELFTGRLTWSWGPYAEQALDAYLEQDPPPGRAAMPEAVVALLRECFTTTPARRPADLGALAGRLIEVYDAAVGRPYPRPLPGAGTPLADGLNNKALSLLDLGRTEQAEEYWRQALQADPRHVDATFNTRLADWRKGRVTDVEMVRELEHLRTTASGSVPDQARASYLLGLVHLERGDLPAATEALREAARVAPLDPEITDALGTATGRTPAGHTPVPLTGHEGKVCPLAVSADGRRGVTGGEDRTVRWWDLDTGECLRTLTGHGDLVVAVDLSADGRHAVSASTDHTVRWWDLDTGRCEAVLTGDEPVWSVALSPDGGHALSGDRTGTLRWWDLRRGTCVRTLTGHGAAVNSVALTPDARRAVSASSDGTVRSWDLAGGRALRTFADHVGPVQAVALTSDGGSLLSCGDDGTVRSWDLDGGQALEVLAYRSLFAGGGILTTTFYAVAVTPDGRYALTGDRDHTVQWWDLRTGRCLRSFAGHDGSVTSLSVAPDGRRALSCGFDHTVRRWDLTPGPTAAWSYSRPRSAEDLGAHAEDFRSRVAAARELLERGDCRAAAAELRQARAIPGYERNATLVELWRRAGLGGRRAGDLLDARPTRHLTTPSQLVLATAVTPNARYGLFALGGDQTVRWWDLAEGGHCLRTLTGHTSPVFSAAVTSDARQAVTGSWDHTLRRWDLTTGRCLGTLTGHTDAVRSIALTADGRRVLSGSWDGTVRWWDLDTGDCLHVLSGDSDQVWAVAVTADGRHGLSGDGTSLRWWDLGTGACDGVFPSQGRGIVSLALTPDGRRAVSGESRGDARAWDVATGRCTHVLSGHAGDVTAVAVTADGRHAMTGAEDGSLRWWDLDTGRCLREAKGEHVLSGAMAPDGRVAVSGGGNGPVRVWELDWDYDFPPP